MAFPAVMTSAADIDTYEPSLYFVPAQTEGVSALPAGNLFVNNNDIPDGADIRTRIYYLDEMKATNMLFAKWMCSSKEITLTDLTDPVTETGASPYEKWSEKGSVPLLHKPDENFMAASYTTITSAPLKLTGESTADYPIAAFTVSIPGNVPVGRYEVSFLTGEGSNVTSVSYSSPLRDIRPSGDNARSLCIGVSDRALGDVNGSGKLEATDASKLLVAYASLSGGGSSGLTLAEEIAGDMNGDGKLTASDASAVLVKYADGQ